MAGQRQAGVSFGLGNNAAIVGASSQCSQRRRSFVNTKPLIHAGIALILLGIVAFIYQGNDGPRHDSVLAIGPPPAHFAISRIMPLPPLIAGMVLLSGILLVVVGIKKSS